MKLRSIYYRRDGSVELREDDREFLVPVGASKDAQLAAILEFFTPDDPEEDPDAPEEPGE